MSDTDEILDRAADAAMALAAERPWREVSLRDIAERAETPLPELYARAASKWRLVLRISDRFDRAALETAATPSDDLHDRLFDAAMARIEAMEPHRLALTAMVQADSPAVLLPHLPRTARAILEAAGIDATPPRILAMTAVWARCVQVWRDDEGALNRTMAEIDKRLKQMRSQLGRIRQGF
jgi:AcrR family transcriptional regulator